MGRANVDPAQRTAKQTYEIEYWAKNREHLNAQQRARRALIREKDRARSAAYRAKNKEKVVAANADWRARNKDSINAKRIEKAYGLSAADYQAIYDLHQGCCGICGVKPHRASRLCVDHDHATGRVRGLLCDRCNTGVGLLGDDPERLRKAAAYLDSPPAQKIAST